MAVGVTYSWSSTGNFTPDAIESRADLIGLTDRGFAGVGDTPGHYDGVIFDSSGVRSGGWTNSTGTNAALAQLSNGNLVSVSQDSNSIHFEIRHESGTIALASKDIGNTGCTNADVAALSGGGFWVASEDLIGGSDSNIVINRYDNSGHSVGGFTVDNSSAADRGVAVAALDGGGVGVAWTRTVGASTQMWYAVYNATGAVVKAPTLIDNVGTINRNVTAVATDTGFAIAYEDNDWSNTIDITLVTFTATGGVIHGTNISNPSHGSDGSDDLAPNLTRLSNGLLAVAYSDNSAANTDTVVRLIDPSTGGILATDTHITGGHPLANDVEDAAIAGYGFGQVAIVQSNLTSGGADGETLQAVRTTTGDSAANVVSGDDLLDIMNGGGGNDTLNGAGNDDTLNGGTGADALNGAAGNDVFVYANAKDSQGANYDTITGFNARNADRFDVPGHITDVDPAINGGALSTASFENNIRGATAHHLGAHHAVVFTPDSGDLHGKTFLIIDLNGKAGYQATHDLVIRLDAATHLADLDAADFI